MTLDRQKELRSIIQQIESILKKNKIQKFMDFSMRLHNFIIKGSKNDLLIRIYGYLQPQRERLRRLIGTEKEDLINSLKEHIAISKALLKGNDEEADRLLTRHIDEGIKRILKNLPKNMTNGTKEIDVGLRPKWSSRKQGSSVK
jgi:DNA-binding GntR family transcriptional regulator